LKSQDAPVATVLLYGPDRHTASKLVVRIVERHSGKVMVERSWTSTTADIRFDQAIYQQALDYIKEQNAEQVVMSDRISGCPHVEGTDYPVGHPCPYCPAWQDNPLPPARSS